MASNHTQEKKMKLMDKEAMSFLERYLTNQAPSGEEEQGQKIWLERLKPYVDDVFTDPYGTAVGVINPDQKFKVVLAAHADEINWLVHYIRPDGYIHVTGTADPGTALGRTAVIRTKKGPVKAIFGWPATHLRKSKQPEPTMSELFLDCGCTSREQVEELGVYVGCTVVYESGMLSLNDQLIVGRALDNRIGGFMLTEVARALRSEGIRLPYTVFLVNAVQEEVGTRGAQMINERLKPDLAIVTDVTHDTSMPGVDKAKHGDVAVGKGPVFSYGPAVHNQVNRLLEKAADEEGIPYQRQAAEKSTGTDTDAFAYGASGKPSGLISIPLKYMHTPVESCDKTCVKDTIRLMLAVLRRIDPEKGYDNNNGLN